jgi:hypothetical protein
MKKGRVRQGLLKDLHGLVFLPLDLCYIVNQLNILQKTNDHAKSRNVQRTRPI